MGPQDFVEPGRTHLRNWVEPAERAFADPAIAAARRVHFLRVTGKRLRAVLGLANGKGKPKRWVVRHSEAIQQAARALSPYRDATVSSELLAKREKKERSERLRALWQTWQAWRLEHAEFDRPPPPAQLTQLLLAVENAETRLGRWLERQSSSDKLLAGWHRSVRELREGADAFFAQPHNDAAHQWRKAMKELWFQTDWIHAMGIEVPLKETKPLDRLSAALGRANDFAVLQDWLWSIQDPPWGADERLILDGNLETMKRKAWQRVGLNWRKVLATLEATPAEPEPAQDAPT